MRVCNACNELYGDEWKQIWKQLRFGLFSWFSTLHHLRLLTQHRRPEVSTDQMRHLDWSDIQTLNEVSSSSSSQMLEKKDVELMRINECLQKEKPRRACHQANSADAKLKSHEHPFGGGRMIC